MSDVMSVRLHLSGIRVRGVLVDSVDRLEVEVESAREWSRCRQCGFKCRRVWDRRAKRVRDLEVSGRRPTLVWRRRGCVDSGRAHLRCSRLNVDVCGLVPLGFQVVASSSIRRYMACASNVPELAVTHSSTTPRVVSFHRWSSASSSNTLVIPAAVFFSAAVALALS